MRVGKGITGHKAAGVLLFQVRVANADNKGVIYIVYVLQLTYRRRADRRSEKNINTTPRRKFFSELQIGQKVSK